MASIYQCPHCGQTVDTDPDRGGGKQQQYIEDCPICCRPNRITATYSAEEDEYWVQADSDS
jgi:hypothetical protein